MKKNYASIVFDRRHTAEKTGFAKVEILVLLSRTVKKYVPVRMCNVLEWKKYKKSSELLSLVRLYNDIVLRMIEDDEELTMANFEAHIGIEEDDEGKKERERLQNSATGFLEFYEAEVAKEKIAANTLKRRKTILLALKEFKKLNAFKGLTPQNVKAFDDFLHEDPTRREQTIYAYHMIVKMFTRRAAQLDIIAKDPYDSPLCRFKKGESRERKPLTEEELLVLRNTTFRTQKEEHARDLFIFSAYTGLAYSDVQNFDFHKMTEQHGDVYFIDGSRMKNGHHYFTPILPPAMEVLEKYHYCLPKISNQKLNDYLHLVEAAAGIKKPMTSHVARHSFATLILAHDVPIENVARMMGHTNIRTTQVYAKILKTTIERHTQNLLDTIK